MGNMTSYINLAKFRGVLAAVDTLSKLINEIVWDRQSDYEDLIHNVERIERMTKSRLAALEREYKTTFATGLQPIRGYNKAQQSYSNPKR